MNALLLYPTLSEQGTGNVGHQTDSLVRATERVLTAEGYSTIAQQQSASTLCALPGSAQPGGEHRLTQDSVALICVIGFHDDLDNDHLQHLARTHHCPVIRLQTRFPGALLRQEIEMDSFGSDGTHLAAINPLFSFDAGAVPESFHYAQFAPRQRTTNGANPSDTMNLSPLGEDAITPLIMLDVTTDSNYQDCHHDVETISATLQAFNTIPELTLVINDCTTHSGNARKRLNDLRLNDLRQELASTLQTKLHTRIVTPTVGNDAQQMIPFLRQFDVGFFGGSRLYADAIELGIPVYAWRQNESTTLLNELFVAQLPKKVNSIRKTLRAHISQLQRELINELPGNSHTTTIANRIDVFDSTLIRLLQQLVPTTNTSVPATALTVPGIPVIPVAELEYPCTPAQYKRRRIQQFQRKLLKFRQSPTRFLRDSQTPLGQRLSDLLPPHNP